MQIEFASLSYGRAGFGLPEAILRNMYPEITPSGPSKSARLPRPGLSLAYSLGSAGVRGIYQQDGAFGGDGFAVAGTTLYRGQTAVGDVGLTRLARFAASYTQLVVVCGGIAYCYDGDSLTAVTIPDDLAVVDVAIVGARFLYQTEASDKFYWSALDDAATIDSLAFATADEAPDATVGMAVLGDRAVFFGRTSTEFWQLTGDADAPLIRSPGTTYTKGCASQASIVAADNRLWMVGSDLKVYAVGGGVPQRVSDHSIEQKLRECQTPQMIAALALTWDGHDFVLLNVPGQGSWALHVESGEWLEWTSYGRTTFRCASALTVGPSGRAITYLGDSDTGNIYTLADTFTDDGDAIEFLASATVPPGTVNALELQAAQGVGLEDNTDPIAEMRYSTDLGRTWTAWRQASLGLIGDYPHRTRWRNLGFCKRPRQVEFRTTSPVRAVFAGVTVNEP